MEISGLCNLNHTQPIVVVDMHVRGLELKLTCWKIFVTKNKQTKNY